MNISLTMEFAQWNKSKLHAIDYGDKMLCGKVVPVATSSETRNFLREKVNNVPLILCASCAKILRDAFGYYVRGEMTGD